MRCHTTKFLLVSGALFLLLFLSPLSAKICDSIDVRNKIEYLNKLRNCTEITGNLNIVLIETTKSVSEYDQYVFPELTRVTGYVLFFKVKHVTSIGKLFPNLRLIRGLELFFEFSLVLYNLPNLKEIGTDKLFYIARGGVKIDKAPQLCYADTIQWRHIGNNTHLDIRDTKDDCPACPEKCNGSCWNQNSCQIFTDQCHQECLGCTENNSTTHCEVCKNYNDNGTCVAKCPSDKYIVRTTNRCISAKACSDLNNETTKFYRNKNWLIYENECRSDCPVGTKYDNTTNTCKSCGNFCVRNCTVFEINNQNAITNLYGCTHVLSPLSIVGLRTEQELEVLKQNLKWVRYIRDYLQISNNRNLKDLNFLPSLRVIDGQNTRANKTLLVYENRNLKKLWDGDYSLKINGTIGFSDNDKLCLSEIGALAKRANISYSNRDVSQNSNGVLCSIPKDESVKVNVTQINSTNVTLVWEKRDESILYYTVYYTDQYNMTADNDVCTASNWITFITFNSSAQLINLTAFTTYYYYIQIYVQDKKSETKVETFQTLADDPEAVKDFIAQAIDHHSIRLIWKEPVKTYGHLSSYTITVYREDDDPNIAQLRDYCKYSHSNKGAEVDQSDDEVVTEKPIHDPKIHSNNTETVMDATCQPEEEVNIRLQNDIWLKLCDKNSQSKYGFDDCKNYYYDRINHIGIPVQKRSGLHIQTPTHKKTSLDHEKPRVFTEIVDATRTTTIVKNLHQFSIYVFYIMACNHPVNERNLCGPVEQTFVRTKKNPSADVIPQNSVKSQVQEYDVSINWAEPKEPNALIVSYHIVYYKKEPEHSKPSRACITREEYKKERGYTLKGMPPGSYSLRLQPVSLAGPGNLTKAFDFVIKPPDSPSKFWLIFLVSFFVLIGICGLLLFLRIKYIRSRERVQLIASINPDYAGLIYIEDEWETNRDDIELRKELGKGTFGVVYYGLIKSKNMPCAVKTVTDKATVQERISFLTEASIMKEFSHAHHVIKLFGVVSRDQPPLVVMELMERGDLKEYLRRLRDSSQNFTSNEIYRMAIEIADGLAYLTSRKYVHRDLAARNCMVANDRTVKIGDFGMTRDIYENDYYKKGTRGLLPVRWMAPESLADGVFTSDSDIWSYGIVLWEIATLAEQPYQGLANEQVLQFVISEGTLERPPECPNLLWEIMHRCWEWTPRDRPTCFEVVDSLQDHVGQDFKLVSYYHSREGQEFLFTQGSSRANNPPALGAGLHQFEPRSFEDDPLNFDELPT
ncbi:insulin-like receptor isoform X2 [Sitophilus oryzae]|uniref:receptor protein-tyrosine kinase n=1 Tax=Sitophilus oryzae TaxID=7048 RepID=A0A6J2X3K2_SITOR|nr:insulin-like receptor isoform X2 [Sitophilus oryzae]